MKWILLIATLLLGGCATVYDPLYICPSMMTDAQFRAAESYVNSVTVVERLPEDCGGRLATGCRDTEDNIFIVGGEHEMDNYVHEVCHFYRYYLLGRSDEDEANHVGWIISVAH